MEPNYNRPDFVRTVIAPTTEGGICYPTPAEDGSPVQPLVLYPPLLNPAGAEPGPARIKVQAFTTLPWAEIPSGEITVGFVSAVRSDGGLERIEEIFLLSRQPNVLTIEAPACFVIEKVETPIACGIDLIGFGDTTTVQS